jgi:hypothetical protein
VHGGPGANAARAALTASRRRHWTLTVAATAAVRAAARFRQEQQRPGPRAG